MMDLLNLSTDSFPWVNILRLEKNTGYAGGNNAGLKVATGEYAALINNDCVVEKDWLVRMVDTAIKKGDTEKVGSVCSKVLFFYRYLPLCFNIEYNPENNGSVSISDLKINCVTVNDTEDLSGHARFINGFLPGPRTGTGEISRWNILDGAVMAVPLSDNTEKIIIRFISLCI